MKKVLQLLIIIFNNLYYIYIILVSNIKINGDWGLGSGDWGLGMPAL